MGTRHPGYDTTWAVCKAYAFCFVDKSGDILPLRSKPIRLVQLKSRGGEAVVCSAVSSSAQWVVYSDQESLRIFNLTIVSA